MSGRMLKIIILLLANAIVYVAGAPKPQDMQTQALLLAGQVKEIVDNGAAARTAQEFEFMGARMGGGIEFGFGDAVRHTDKGFAGRRRRFAATPADVSLATDSNDDSISISDALKRRKRSAYQRRGKGAL